MIKEFLDTEFDFTVKRWHVIAFGVIETILLIGVFV